ncbi:transcription factor bHLH104-like [Hibiscus syriacus]|uniref:transcription factor bHLH104-like n=1 Tax=Hibiscus syriacus TaxID=106335 RepID=UPI00192317A0|nr:transcription factor bHLH104-like [Hibiscus syriacus]
MKVLIRIFLEKKINLIQAKNEPRAEKLVLKANKERIEQQLKTMTVPPTGYVHAHPVPYHPGANKMAVFPSCGLVPMWQYLPPSVRDTSQDHELRTPAA